MSQVPPWPEEGSVVWHILALFLFDYCCLYLYVSLSPPYRPVLLEFPRAGDQPFFRRPSSQVSLDSSTSSCTHLSLSPPCRPVLLELPRAGDQPFLRRPSSQLSRDSSISSCSHRAASS